LTCLPASSPRKRGEEGWARRSAPSPRLRGEGPGRGMRGHSKTAKRKAGRSLSRPFSILHPERSGGFGGVCFSSNAGLVGCALGIDVAIDELDDGERGVVAVAVAGLHDAQVATVAAGVPRRDRVEQLRND